MTREMLTNVQERRRARRVPRLEHAASLLFFHGGRDDGFDAYMGGYAETGQGVAIMINANDNSGMMRRIYEFVAREYGWPGSAPQFALTPGARSIGADRVVRRPLRGGEQPDGDTGAAGWQARVDGGWAARPGLRSDRRVAGDERGPVAPVHLRARCGGNVVGFSRAINGKDVTAPRVSPLLKGAKPQRDPDPARTAQAGVGPPRPGRGWPGASSSRGIYHRQREGRFRRPVTGCAEGILRHHLHTGGGCHRAGHRAAWRSGDNGAMLPSRTIRSTVPSCWCTSPPTGRSPTTTWSTSSTQGTDDARVRSALRRQPPARRLRATTPGTSRGASSLHRRDDRRATPRVWPVRRCSASPSTTPPMPTALALILGEGGAVARIVLVSTNTAQAAGRHLRNRGARLPGRFGHRVRPAPSATWSTGTVEQFEMRGGTIYPHPQHHNAVTGSFEFSAVRTSPCCDRRRCRSSSPAPSTRPRSPRSSDRRTAPAYFAGS